MSTQPRSHVLAIRPVRTRCGAARELALRLLLLVGLVGLLAGCDEGGGGTKTPAQESVAAPAGVIDLPPGQTQVSLSWEASEGGVDHYLVLVSRNGGSWTLLDSPTSPPVALRGTAGDEVQVRTVAIGLNQSMSPASPPSPTIRFHAAPDATALTTTRAASPAFVESASQTTATVADSEEAADAATPPSDGSTAGSAAAAGPVDSTTSAAPSDTGSDPAAVAPLATSDRPTLLLGDPRLSLRARVPAVASWLADRLALEDVDAHTFVGFGRLDDDGLTELVWRDANGRLAVSDGASLESEPSVSATFRNGIQLGVGERFVALADFGGDEHSDWLVENESSGEVWLVDDRTLEARDVRPDNPEQAPRLAGHGDLDGDGREELVWCSASGALLWSRADDASLHAFAGDTTGSDRSLLLVDDFDGDGRDDLLLETPGGGLELAFLDRIDGVDGLPKAPDPAIDSGMLAVERVRTPDRTSLAGDLLAALDVDGDGAAELAWLHEDGIEIWNAQSGLEVARFAR